MRADVSGAALVSLASVSLLFVPAMAGAAEFDTVVRNVQQQTVASASIFHFSLWRAQLWPSRIRPGPAS